MFASGNKGKVTVYMRVLLVEDDEMIGHDLRPILEKDGMAVDWVRSATEAAAAIANEDYAIALLDLGLPDRSGLEFLIDLRKTGCDLSVLIITARDRLQDRVRGLDLGADDYVVKPFEVPELLARMRVLTRRRSGVARSWLEAQDLILDLVTQEMTYHNVAFTLSRREFALMRALLQRPGAIMSRSRLEESLYGWNAEIESNTIDFLIHSIRRKYGKNIIRNVRGAGWMVVRK